MRTIMSKTPHDSSFSFSRRYFHWKPKQDEHEEEEEEYEDIFTFNSSDPEELKFKQPDKRQAKSKQMTVTKLWTALTDTFTKNNRANLTIGTLFGYRRGHVHLAFQYDSKVNPAYLLELVTPTSVLIKEMASGLVRIALECDRKFEKKGQKLLEEPIWRTYCNGKKCGYAIRRECGAEELKVLSSVGPITMGAGVIPGSGGPEGEMMFMRAKFERVVGSKDSEAFYMMNPDGNGGPELSIYLLRV